MIEYENKFSIALNDEQKTALVWKIEEDYQRSAMSAFAFKDEYLTFAINFYTRTSVSLDDVVEQYRNYIHAERRKTLAEAFLTDIRTRLRERELAFN